MKNCLEGMNLLLQEKTLCLAFLYPRSCICTESFPMKILIESNFSYIFLQVS